MEDGTVTAMTLFHLSAAFDTTDHIIQSINQTNKLLHRQYPRRSEAQWRHSQISVQQQSPGNSSVTSTGHEQWRYPKGERPMNYMEYNSTTDKRLSLFDLSEREGIDAASMERR